MKRKYDETEQQAAERFITERKQAADLFPFLCSVFRAFDGKVFNKRLETALQAGGLRIYAQKLNNNINIWYYSASGRLILSQPHQTSVLNICVKPIIWRRSCRLLKHAVSR